MSIDERRCACLMPLTTVGSFTIIYMLNIGRGTAKPECEQAPTLGSALAFVYICFTNIGYGSAKPGCEQAPTLGSALAFAYICRLS